MAMSGGGGALLVPSWTGGAALSRGCPGESGAGEYPGFGFDADPKIAAAKPDRVRSMSAPPGELRLLSNRTATFVPCAAATGNCTRHLRRFPTAEIHLAP